MTLRAQGHEARPGFGWDSLSESELRVADLVVWGYSNKEIAERLNVAPHRRFAPLPHLSEARSATRVEPAGVIIERSVAPTKSA